MMQLDLFDEKLETKVKRMEKTVARFQKELWFLKNVMELRQQVDKQKEQVKQLELWGT